MTDNNELLNVLDAREVRWQKRLEMAADCGQTLVTITLCLPLVCRTHHDYTSVFPRLCGKVLRRLNFGGVTAGSPTFLEGADGPACLLSVSGDAVTIKRLCIASEEKIPGGRMLDVDVMDSNGNPVGRSEIGLPPRSCFVCDEPAAVCVSRKLHPAEEILRRAHELLIEAQG